MSNILESINDYFRRNKGILFGYGLLTVLFYSINFAFFSESIDLPPDILLIFAYIVFSPGITAMYTLSKSLPESLNSNKAFFNTLVMHTIVVLLINVLALGIYEAYRATMGYWESIYIALLFSLPVILIGIIIAFEYKLDFENLRYKLLGLIIFILSWYILSLIFDTTVSMIVINGLYFMLVPLMLVVFWYRKRLTN